VETSARFDQKTLDLFRTLIHRETGITITRQKDYLLISKLGRMIRNSAYSNAEDLYHAIQKGDLAEWQNLVSSITTNHTFFFRERTHLKILKGDIQLRKISCPLIWVAASSTGEEVISIIIELLEAGITNFKILASDISKDVLIRMKRGLYSAQRFEEVSPDIIGKYFQKVQVNREQQYRVRDSLKSYFVAKQLNLIEPLKFQDRFDYIFCRNVLIYFNLETQKRVVSNLLANLKDYGYLFVGHSETLMNISDEVETVFTSVYNKKL
jgi:chemotaxis protein methyltransferase CheR